MNRAPECSLPVIGSDDVLGCAAAFFLRLSLKSPEAPNLSDPLPKALKDHTFKLPAALVLQV